MNIRSTIVRIAALALVAAPVAVLAPAPAAHAAETLTTTTTLTLYYNRTVAYGDTVDLVGKVVGSDTYSAYDGTAQLQASPYPYTSWTTVATQEASGFMLFNDLKPSISTHYRLVYGGFTATDTYSDSYTPSTSAVVSQAVSRKLIVHNHRLHLFGAVKPGGRLKLVFARKAHGKYRPWFTTKTKKNGKWEHTIHGAIGTKVRISVPGGPGYAPAYQFGSIVAG
ncbi:MAG: hypothetical protein ACXVWW_03800 [Nocardioides sp.]